MSKTVRDGALFSGKGLTGSISAQVHSHAGRLLGLVISHTETTAQSVIFYDSTTSTAGTEIAAFRVDPNQSPWALFLPRDAGIPFDTALYITASNCDVLIWSVDYG
jgi:hypothetical protein